MILSQLSPADLDPVFLREHLYPDLEHTLFWSQRWEPGFYIALAEAGFISISMADPGLGDVLIAELQESYAVLDWDRLHVSRHLGKLLRSGRIESEGVELRVVDDPAPVITRLLEQYRESTWLTDTYVELLHRLPTADVPAFSLHGVELWSRERDLLVAGELGYTIGRTYTSLSGFHTPDTVDAGRWRHFGTLQMWLLAKRLQERSYAFWNLGHPYQGYKTALGARLLPRGEFLERWLKAQGERTSCSLR